MKSPSRGRRVVEVVGARLVDVVCWSELGWSTWSGGPSGRGRRGLWSTWSARLMAQALAWWLDAVVRVRRVGVVVGQA